MTSLGTLDDGALIERTLAGQNECFDILMARHTAGVRRRVASLVRNRADQDDLIQETFLKAWRYLPSFRHEASFHTWINRVATNEVLQQFRRSSSIVQGAPDLDDQPSCEESPFEALIRLETRHTIRTAVAGLPEKYRLVLISRDLHEMTTGETARRFRAGRAFVKSRLFRARQMLSKALLRDEPGRASTSRQVPTHKPAAA